MRKILTTGLILSLVMGAFLFPAEAGKKKKKPPAPVELKFFFHGDACDDATFLLTLSDGPDASCWFTRSGLVYEAQLAAGDDPRTLGQTFVAAEGLPFVLDMSKKITGEITTSGFQGVLGAGQPTLEVTVLGTVGGEEKELGTHSETFTVGPTQQHTTILDLALDPALAGLGFDGFSVHVFTHGASFGHGVIEMEDPPSFIVVPTLQMQ